MKYINLFFHIYQPPTQSVEMLNRIVEQSYRPLTTQFLGFPNLKFTLNISYSLAELLNAYGFGSILSDIKKAYESGILELTATGAYHPIFPLIPEEEVRRQLDLNTEGVRNLITPNFDPPGVFPPEMAFDGNLAAQFRALGYQWTITDDSCLGAYAEPVPYNKIYLFEGLAVFFRSNFWTNKFAEAVSDWRHGKDAVKDLRLGLDQWFGEEDGYLIIALDGETFGHHHPQLGEEFLNELFLAFQETSDELRLVHLSEIYNLFPRVQAFIPPGSWSADKRDIAARDYFAWWKSNNNPIHQLQWEFTNFVLRNVRSIDDRDLHAAMDKALYSCQYWWACFWKFNPGEIYRGAFNMMQLLQRVARARQYRYDEIKRGEDIFRELVIEVERERNRRET
jgi:predicted glycosyl hydrolase (DUF1957 family)